MPEMSLSSHMDRASKEPNNAAGPVKSRVTDLTGRIEKNAIGIRMSGGIKGKQKEKVPKGFWSNKCEHDRVRRLCRECNGKSLCEHLRPRSVCKLCGGKSICEHGRRRNICVACGGSSVCEHRKLRPFCRDCKGSQICPHGRRKNLCVACGGSGICEHKQHRYRCTECKLDRECVHRQQRHTCAECKVLRECGAEGLARKVNEMLSEWEKEGMLPEQMLYDEDPRKEEFAQKLDALRTLTLAFAPAPRPKKYKLKGTSKVERRTDLDKESTIIDGRDVGADGAASAKQDPAQSAKFRNPAQQTIMTKAQWFIREHVNLHARHLQFHAEAAAICAHGLPYHLHALQQQHGAANVQRLHKLKSRGGGEDEGKLAVPSAPAPSSAQLTSATPAADNNGNAMGGMAGVEGGTGKAVEAGKEAQTSKEKDAGKEAQTSKEKEEAMLVGAQQHAVGLHNWWAPVNWGMGWYGMATNSGQAAGKKGGVNQGKGKGKGKARNKGTAAGWSSAPIPYQPTPYLWMPLPSPAVLQGMPGVAGAQMMQAAASTTMRSDRHEAGAGAGVGHEQE